MLLGVILGSAVIVVNAETTIYIRDDGSVTGTNSIQVDGNIYTFTDDIVGSVVVEKDNIVIDGNGHKIKGTNTETASGISMDADNGTIKNLKVNHCQYGINLKESSFNIVTNCSVTKCTYGINVREPVGGGIDAKRNLISNNNLTNNDYGIHMLYYADFNYITGNIIANNTEGIHLYRVESNTISNNIIANNTEYGIRFFGSDVANNSFSSNTVTGNNIGIYFDAASSNKVSDNIIANNKYGLQLDSSTNYFRNNNIYENTYNLNLIGYYSQDLDTSNKINGKPIYCWINQHNRTVPSDSGYLFLINCSDITVKKLDFSKNGQGMYIVYTTNTTITENNITATIQGIVLVHSSNNVIANNNITGNNKAIYLTDSSHNKIVENNMCNNTNGIEMYKASNNTVSENILLNNNNGIKLEYSPYDTINGNTITGNRQGSGIYLSRSHYSILTNNCLTQNSVGLTIYASSNNTLRDNRIGDNEWNLKVEGQFMVNDIDSSNTVDGKPIYYWINQTNKVVPLDAGYVCLINCDQITVQNLTLVDNHQGILVVSTINSTISGNHISYNGFGIFIYQSSKIKISNNYMAKNVYGIELWGTLTQNCTIVENVISNNNYGVYLAASGDSTFCHNDFFNNTRQAYHYWYDGGITPPIHSYSWDNGVEGNYWSDYNGTDADGDSIGDTPYVITEKNEDNYPLMEPYNMLSLQPPNICITSRNTAYSINNVSINFAVNEETSWMGYSLDEQTNVTITENTINLTGLTGGSHNITIYAVDIEGNMGTSETFTFTVAKEPNPPLTWMIAVIGATIVAVAIASVLVYFRKTKKNPANQTY